MTRGTGAPRMKGDKSASVSEWSIHFNSGDYNSLSGRSAVRIFWPTHVTSAVVIFA